jgi:hypothetical protein
MQQVWYAAAGLLLLCVHAGRRVKFSVLQAAAVLPGVIHTVACCDLQTAATDKQRRTQQSQ